MTAARPLGRSRVDVPSLGFGGVPLATSSQRDLTVRKFVLLPIGASPLASGLSWTVAFEPAERDFIGRTALEKQKAAGSVARFVGLVLEDKGVLRGHQKIYAGEREVGEITSGGFSPTLERSIAMARISAGAGDELTVDIRGKRLAVRRVKMPFARNGKACIDL